VAAGEPVCQDFRFDYSWNEGPTWVPSQGAFFFSSFEVGSPSGGHIIKFVPGAGCEIFLADVGCNGLATSIDGNLLAACQQSRSVVHVDLVSKELTTVADQYMGQMLDTPNDLVQHDNGSIYFTNPTYELGGRPEGIGSAAFRVDPAGEISMLGEGPCNGIVLSPDQSRLYVISLGIWDLDDQGVPSNRQEMFTRGDGMAVDCAGNIYANGSIWSPDGENIGSWGEGTNLAFGGEDGTSLFVVASGRVRLATSEVPGPP
jgi:gluconolactonase